MEYKENERTDANGGLLRVGRLYRVEGKEMTLVSLHKYIARFEYGPGIKTCYSYWDLQRDCRPVGRG